MNESSEEKIFFLINPKSGGGRTSDVLRNLKEYSKSSERAIEVEELNIKGLAEQLIRARNADIIVIGGGDGTFSTIFPDLCGIRSKIGILPLGTGNDLAKELEISGRLDWKDASQMVQFYRDASSREIAYFSLEYGEQFELKANFINYVSFGFEAKVVDAFARLRETRLWRVIRGVWSNRLGYSAVCLRLLNARISTKTPFTISNNESSHPLNTAKSIIFTNICSMMGMGKSNLHSSIFDEQIECVITDNLLNYLSMLAQHKLRICLPRYIGKAKTWQIEGLPAAVPIQIDGEPRPDIAGTNFRISYAGKILMIIDC